MGGCGAPRLTKQYKLSPAHRVVGLGRYFIPLQWIFREAMAGDSPGSHRRVNSPGCTLLLAEQEQPSFQGGCYKCCSETPKYHWLGLWLLDLGLFLCRTSFQWTGPRTCSRLPWATGKSSHLCSKTEEHRNSPSL